MNLRLYHVSDRPGITRFEPRPPPSPDAGITGQVVWAISERLLHNYLLPRNCPRVTFYAQPGSAPDDVERFFAGTIARHVVAVETSWLDRIRSARLWCYEVPTESFSLVDDRAGYFVSREVVTPLSVTEISDVLGALVARTPSLWKLRDAILASTLGFSFIRMRHAQPCVPEPLVASSNATPTAEAATRLNGQ